MSPIEFLGNTYNSFMELPPEVQQRFIIESEYANSIMTASPNGFVINGTTYATFDDMPEDLRAVMRAVFDALQNMGMVSKTAHDLARKTKGR